MILGIAYDYDSPSAGFDFAPLGNAFFGVIGALGVKIRADFADDRAHVFFREDHNGVDVGQRSENFCALFGRHHGTAFAFQGAYGFIGIYRDDEFASEFTSGVEIADVSNVQYVEATVGEGDSISGGAPLQHQLMELAAGNNFWMM
jgi:hypothetical protein